MLNPTIIIAIGILCRVSIQGVEFGPEIFVLFGSDNIEFQVTKFSSKATNSRLGFGRFLTLEIL